MVNGKPVVLQLCLTSLGCSLEIDTPPYLFNRPPTTNGGPLQFQSNYLIPYYADSMEVNPQYEDIDTFQRKPSEYEVACPTPPQPRPWPEDDVEIEVCLGYENTAISQESDTPTASTDGHE